MNTKTATLSARLVLGAAILTTILAAGTAAAASHDVTVAIHLSTAGVDLTDPAQAQRFYQRVEDAAWKVCTPDIRVALEPVDDAKGCLEKALGAAIRSLKAPQLTQIYLASHTLQQAKAYGIEIPAQLAATK